MVIQYDSTWASKRGKKCVAEVSWRRVAAAALLARSPNALKMQIAPSRIGGATAENFLSGEILRAQIAEF